MAAASLPIAIFDHEPPEIRRPVAAATFAGPQAKAARDLEVFVSAVVSIDCVW